MYYTTTKHLSIGELGKKLKINTQKVKTLIQHAIYAKICR